jgi:hypothetical protein
MSKAVYQLAPFMMMRDPTVWWWRHPNVFGALD